MSGERRQQQRQGKGGLPQAHASAWWAMHSRMYLMARPRTNTSGWDQNFWPSLEVMVTSFRARFIKLSEPTRLPLYVSPFLSSTSMGWRCAALSRLSGKRLIQGQEEMLGSQWAVT